MTRVEFANLLFYLEELLVEVDYYRRQINDCRKCRGWEDMNNMCPACLEALQSEFEAMKKLSSNAEFMEIMRSIKGALQDDDAGELAQIMTLARRATEN
jgi:hypothetical protein